MARPARRLLRALALVLLSGCGGGATATSSTACVTPAPPPPPSAVAAPVSAVASTGRVDPGGTVTVTVTVTGPAQVHIDDCGGPLRLTVVDPSDAHVFAAQSPPITDPAQCPAAALAAGQTLQAAVTWPVDVTLPGGVYTLILVLGDQPQISLAVAVGAVHC
jgi:hypothetical protein